MSELIDDKTNQEVQKILKSMINPVEVIFFTRSAPCPFCEQQRKILDIISTLSDKIRIKTFDFDKDKKLVIIHKIDKAPATLIIGEKDYGIKFYGITGGHEFTSLIQSLIMASTRKSGLHPELEKLVKNIKKPVHIEVMVTLTCPYCPAAVHAAHQFAMINDNINADMIDSSVFQELAEKYQVVGVPKTIINEIHRFEGAQPPQSLYLEILKTVDPDEYQRVEAMIREQSGHRHIRKPDPGKVYDTIIIGGGPAAMSAAVYAARKDLDVLLITNKIGGQITYTASIDNYLGLPSISGEEMKTQFTFHMEQYPIAESIGCNVSRVEKKENTFLVITEDKKQYTGFTVIFCTGKEYNRLGVPGEERFLGHGIAFCATCDAPLYRSKKVAVIGGGNSAFTAARDLIAFASDIYLIHRSSEFRADSTLVNEVKKD